MAARKNTPEKHRVAAAAPAAPARPPAPPLTYGALDAALDQTKRADTGNLHTTLKHFMRVHGFDHATPLGDELAGGYPDAYMAYRVRRAAEASAPSAKTIQVEASRLNRIQGIAASLRAGAAVTGETFTEVLRSALAVTKANGLSNAQIQREAGLRTGSMYQWTTGMLPQKPEIRGRIPALEHALGLTPGRLMTLLPPLPADSQYAPRNEQGRTPFARRLVQEMAARELSVAEVGRLIGRHPATVGQWVAGTSFPGAESRQDILDRLAHTLGTSYAELEALLPPLPMVQRPYRKALPPQAQREWEEYKAFKTNKYSIDGALPGVYWKINKRGVCPSARKRLKSIEQLYGWLSADKKTWAKDDYRHGVTVTDASFGLIDFVHPPMLMAFLQWQAARSGKVVYTSNQTDSIAAALELLQPKLVGRRSRGFRASTEGGAGFVWLGRGTCRQSAVARGLVRGTEGGLPTDADWREYCAACFAKLSQFRVTLERGGLRARNVKSHIAPIVHSKEPLVALGDLVQRFAADIERTRAIYHVPADATNRRIAVMERDLLLISLISDCPMRHEQWASLTYRADNTGHLRRLPPGQNEDSDWVIIIPQEEMKITKKDEEDFTVPIAREHSARIDNYLTIHRAVLAGAAACDYVLRPRIHPGQDPTAKFLQASSQIEKCSRLYLSKELGGKRGFSTHAIRHIVATHWVKNYGDAGILMAARILNNTVEQIKERYGKITKAEEGKAALAAVQAERRKLAARRHPEAN